MYNVLYSAMSRTHKSAKPSAFYTFENPQIYKSAFYQRPYLSSLYLKALTVSASITSFGITVIPSIWTAVQLLFNKCFFNLRRFRMGVSLRSY